MSIPPKVEDNEAARQIAKAAARLFATRGYEATSTREIVEAAGVAKPTLYYHFGNKEGLAKALLVDPLAELVARLGEIVAERAGPAATLERILEAHFAYCREDPDRSRFFFAAKFGPPEGSTASLMECRNGELENPTDGVFRDCVEAGCVSPRDLDAFATMFRGMMVMSVIEFLYHDKPLGEDRAGTLVAALLRAFEGRATDAGRDDRP